MQEAALKCEWLEHMPHGELRDRWSEPPQHWGFVHTPPHPLHIAFSRAYSRAFYGLIKRAVHAILSHDTVYRRFLLCLIFSPPLPFSPSFLPHPSLTPKLI